MADALCRFDTRDNCPKNCPFYLSQKNILEEVAFESGISHGDLVSRVKLASPVTPQYTPDHTPMGEPYRKYLCDRFYKH